MEQRKPGKIVRNNLYIHRDYRHTADIPEHLYITRYDRMMGKDMPGVDIIKHDRNHGTVSLIKCFDFDGLEEPIIQMVWTDLRQINYTYYTGAIYHHKWMMVGDDYRGFDMEASKRRSERIKQVMFENPGIAPNQIGNQVYWETRVLPLL
jgi:hypothetical protein